MRVIFAGTPEFARVALAQLYAAGFEIALALTQPDRPAGRGLKLQPSAVKQWAQTHQIRVAQPRSLRLDGKYPQDAAEAHATIAAVRADVMVVAAYGLILPTTILTSAARLGCINIHGSLLPRWRGAAPIHRAIEAGDAETGVTIMQMDAGLDTGDMLLAEKLPISPRDTTGTLHDKVAALGARLVVEALELAACGGLRPMQQPEAGVTYAHKVEKQEARIDWREPAASIERKIRAFNPFPIAHSFLGHDSIKLLEAELLDVPRPASLAHGLVVAAGANGVDVAAGDAVLRITRLQKAGGKSLAAAEFLRGYPVQAGQVFTASEA
jgi:methionyl-tRNA formyltransferase